MRHPAGVRYKGFTSEGAEVMAEQMPVVLGQSEAELGVAKLVWNKVEEPYLEPAKAVLAPKKTPTIRGATPLAGRNDPCPCDSGKKFKKCHLPVLETGVN